MPTYDFLCEPCNKRFEEFTSYDESGVYEGVKCPLCGCSDKKIKVPSVVAFSFANPVGTDRWNSDKRGHDFRFKHNVPNVKAQREFAQANSHMGGTDEIYGTGQADKDINTDRNWGEVK
jgi:putative FmdB family regulatory protein